MPWYNKRTRQQDATLLTSTTDHKQGTVFRASPAGWRQGQSVFHCYSETGAYVGLFEASALKLKP